MKGVARGLHTLHNANIIHGSLHQNNVFALNREQGIVGDFDFTKSEVKYHICTGQKPFNKWFKTSTQSGNVL